MKSEVVQKAMSFGIIRVRKFILSEQWRVLVDMLPFKTVNFRESTEDFVSDERHDD